MNQKQWINELSNVQSDLESFFNKIDEYSPIEKGSKSSTLECIGILLNSFHLVAKQLNYRYNGRSTIQIEDEYDVQDLLHALLKIYFDDIRTEEVCPSYAGRSSRVDFLLKTQRVMIEVKKTRKSLGEKEIGEQLIIDTARYSNHPDIDTLVCFVYDPEELIKNPKGMITDLEKRSTNDIEVRVFIVPNSK